MSALPVDGPDAVPQPPAGSRRLVGCAARTLAEHQALLGPLPPTSGPDLVDDVAQAGLTGRGGAGFPTAVKLRAVRDAGRGGVVIANGCEGEPLSRKDVWLLTQAPHLVLDGLEAARRVVRARRAVLVTEDEQAAGTVRRAAAERSSAVEVLTAPRRFLSGEETALVSLVDGGPGVPQDKAVRVTVRGVGGRPTLVDNVETLAHLALIARFGADWFREQGTRSEPGTTLVTVSGAVARPGVLEVPLGTGVPALLEAARAHPAHAVLVGGFHGAWLPAAELATASLSRASLSAWQGTVGAGVVHVLGEDECGLRRSAEIVSYLADAGARQCGPCVNGLPALAGTTTRIAAAEPSPALVEHAVRLSSLVRGRGACAHPTGVAALVASSLHVFAEEVSAHAQGRCRASTARRLDPL